jgi:tyrosyl-tRNA synthetase
MSISDDLMWSYYELLTDLTLDEIRLLRSQAASGDRHPRDLKVELAKRIVIDFHSVDDAKAAEEEFNRVFRQRQAPDAVESRLVRPVGKWKITRLLVEVDLAPSMSEARRLIDQGGVRIEGEPVTKQDAEIEITNQRNLLIQVGKRRFLRVKGWGER